MNTRVDFQQAYTTASAVKALLVCRMGAFATIISLPCIASGEYECCLGAPLWSIIPNLECDASIDALTGRQPVIQLYFGALLLGLVWVDDSTPHSLPKQ